jgi:outer membrane protein OmpA-like peptidoglycan-associated protein/tetratricopeptide (TPR) repeat protein
MRSSMLWLFLVGISFFINMPAQAQTSTYQNLSLKELRKKAKQQYKLGDWYGAINSYEQAYEKAEQQKGKPETQFALSQKLAKLYRKIRNYREASRYYQQLAKKRLGAYPKARFRWALMEQQQGHYEKAIELLKQVKKRYRGQNTYQIKQQAKASIKGAKKAIRQGVTDQTKKLTQLDSTINSPYSEFSPTFLNDTAILYASRKVDSLLQVDRGAKAPKRTRFYKALFERDEGWQHHGPWQKLSDIDGNLGNGAFGPDQKRFYFTKCRFSPEDQAMRCKLHVAKRSGNTWKDPVKLPAPVNTEGTSSTHPATATIMKSRKEQQVLIFSSNRDQGRGQMDLWYSVYDPADNSYDRPRNLGRKVNTKRDEVTPFYDSATGKLFFSSNGHGGFGGLDVYAVTGEFGRYRDEPEHLNAPENSPADDLYYRKFRQGASFVVSNRPGVQALKHKTCCDDLFAIDLPARDTAKQLLVEQLKGVIKAETTDDTSITDSNQETVITLRQTDTASGEEATVIRDTLTRKDSGRFNIPVEAFDKEEAFYIEASREGYQRAISDSLTRQALTNGQNKTRLSLTRKKQEQQTIPGEEKTATEDKATAKADTQQVARSNKAKDSIAIAEERAQTRVEEEQQQVRSQKAQAEEQQQQANDQEESQAKVETKGDQAKTKREAESRTASESTANEATRIPNVTYGFNKASLDQQARKAIDTTVLQLLQNRPNVKVQIRSHTDNAGSDSYNMKLSQKRAQRVVEYLVEQGIDRKRLEAKGFGERKPVAPNFNLDGTDNPEGRQKNRRTDFKVIGRMQR